MTDPFYTTEPYREAREQAEHDLANWPDSGIGKMKIEHNWPKQERKFNREASIVICVALSIGIVLSWIGAAYYVSNAHTYTPSPAIVHQSSGL